MWGGGEHPWGWRPGTLATHAESHASPAAIQWSWRLGPAPSVERESGTSSSGRSPALARLEAALFVAEGALTAKKLAQFAALPDSTSIPAMVEELNAGYEADQSAWRVERLATGYQLMTRPVFARWLDKVHERQARLKLSPPAMETLTIIAYRQPLTRADLEEVRGVQSTELLKQLMERGLVKVVGEHDSLGRPYLYGTTRLFLESFGIRSLEDMPMADELRKPANAQVAEVNADPEVAA